MLPRPANPRGGSLARRRRLRALRIWPPAEAPRLRQRWSHWRRPWGNRRRAKDQSVPERTCCHELALHGGTRPRLPLHRPLACQPGGLGQLAGGRHPDGDPRGSQRIRHRATPGGCPPSYSALARSSRAGAHRGVGWRLHHPLAHSTAPPWRRVGGPAGGLHGRVAQRPGVSPVRVLLIGASILPAIAWMLPHLRRRRGTR